MRIEGIAFFECETREFIIAPSQSDKTNSRAESATKTDRNFSITQTFIVLIHLLTNTKTKSDILVYKVKITITL